KSHVSSPAYSNNSIQKEESVYSMKTKLQGGRRQQLFDITTFYVERYNALRNELIGTYGGGDKMISVIIPVYNGEKYIDRVYDSFVKQTYTDFELIFVNDGSTDESIKKIETLSAENTVPITYMTQTRGGVSAARNTGLALAKGDYICFCDV